MAAISELDKAHRRYWIEEIARIGRNFGDESERLERELSDEIDTKGVLRLVNHLRLAGDIPESYGHDTSEEKQYSKYTDAVISKSFKCLGLRSLVLKERADAADVEAFGRDFSLVADAKAFRLSRTAKNQKDFKVLAMDGWRRGKDYAVVVCPIHQLPTKSSQIYQQATGRDVCILTYSHLAVVVRFAAAHGVENGEALLKAILGAVSLINPSKDSVAYWTSINRSMLEFHAAIADLWLSEKAAAVEAIEVAKQFALDFLSAERERIVRLTHEEAIRHLLEVHKVESRMAVIRRVASSRIMDLG